MSRFSFSYATAMLGASNPLGKQRFSTSSRPKKADRMDHGYRGL
jgi:hypothetical protein